MYPKKKEVPTGYHPQLDCDIASKASRIRAENAIIDAMTAEIMARTEVEVLEKIVDNEMNGRYPVAKGWAYEVIRDKIVFAIQKSIRQGLEGKV